MELFLQLINLLTSKWYLGLLVSGTVEGLSLPFPSQPLVLYIGHVLLLKNINLIIAGGAFAISYTVASLVPYLIGMRYCNWLTRSNSRLKKYLIKGEDAFCKYGDIAVLLTRPFAIGNYVSYLAGTYRMNIFKYLCYTFLGIFSWSVAVLYLGGLLGLKLNAIIKLMVSNLEEGVLLFILIAGLVFIISIFFRSTYKTKP